jgi:predicted  nucleic acid-binding Zn-ribbon protein
MSQFLDLFVNLQNKVDEFKNAEARLAGVPDWMAELHEEHSARKARIEEWTEKAEAAAVDRREAEAAIAELETKRDRYQEQINQVSTQREYGALLAEIDTTRKHLEEQEAKKQGAVETREEAQKALAEEEQDFAVLDERYRSELEKWEAEKPSVAKAAEQLKGEISKIREKLPRPYLAQYDRIAERHGGEALSPVLRLARTNKRSPDIWHCGSCNYNVRPQVVVELAGSGNFVLCDSCKRILYLPPDEGEGDEDEG